MGAEIVEESSWSCRKLSVLRAKYGSWWIVHTYKRRRETVYETVVDKEHRTSDGLQIKERQRVAIRESDSWEKALLRHEGAVGAIQRDGKLVTR